MVENSVPEETDTQAFQEIVLNEVLQKGKDVIHKFHIGSRKIVFETNLRRAVEMAEVLRIVEGYVRSNVFKKYQPKRKNPSQTTIRKSAESPNIHVFSVEEHESKRRKGTSPGRAVYECHCHRPRQEEVRIRRLAEGKTIQRKRNSIGRGCHAKITIRFAEGYTQEKKVKSMSSASVT